jgi:hypothetical protein
MRMFVSTKNLSLMEIVARRGRRPLEIEAVTEARQGPPTRSVERLSLADNRLESVGEKRTDRAPFFGRHHTRLSKQIGIELERHVGLHDVVDGGT